MREYGDAKMNQYFRVIPELFWEMKSEEPSTNGKVRYRFKHSPDGRADDERFEGPAVRADEFPLNDDSAPGDPRSTRWPQPL